MKTLAMMKMEKNFIAVMEKKYPRQPYDVFTIDSLLRWLEDEVKELHKTIEAQDKLDRLPF